MNNSEVIARALDQAGVRWVFGVPSGPVLPLIDALGQSSVEFVLTASETSAGFMASAVGYLTAVPGVCVSTVGPGATNLATGVGCAWLDRLPVLAITCNVATPWLQRRIQMRIDHHALFAPLSKATIGLREHCARSIKQAIALAIQEPPGPVHLDLPEDIAQAEPMGSAEPFTKWSAPPDCSGELVQILQKALAHSRRPLLIAGLTVTRIRAARELINFVERQRLPFVTTMHAKGFLPENHANWAGVIGRARRSDVKKFIDRADLIIAVGYDPVEINYEEWVGDRSIVHISTETADRGNDLRFVWNQACDLDAAVEAMSAIERRANDWAPAELQEHRMELDRALRPTGAGFAPHHVLDILRAKLPSDGILAYDVGAHTHQIATQWRTDVARTLLATNGWSSMGYGMPAAYAAKLVHPGRAVVAVIGDGGFQMTAGELALARRLNLPVPVIILNDGWLALMKVKQERKNYSIAGVYLGAPPQSPAHYFGVPCRSAKNADEFARALDWAFNLGAPSVIEAFIDAAAYSRTVFD